MNPKINIPHPETERGRANALLLFILAFIAASFTLVAGTSNTGKKYSSIQKNSQCTFGSTVHFKDKEGNIIGCERPILSMQICKDCEPGDNPNTCDCKNTCVPSGSVQPGVWEKRTTTEIKEVKGDAKVDAAWKLISIGAGGTRKYEVKSEGKFQCYFDRN